MRERAEPDLAAAEQLAGVHTARIAALEEINTVRGAQCDRTRPQRERSEHAGELESRSLDRDGATPTGEQVELFTIAEPDPSAERGREGAEQRGRPGAAAA